MVWNATMRCLSILTVIHHSQCYISLDLFLFSHPNLKCVHHFSNHINSPYLIHPFTRPIKTSVETALLAQQLGTRAIIIIEKLHEIDLVLAASKKLDIKPIIGVRARLSQRGSGRWGDSTGDRAKFGLSCADMIEVCVWWIDSGKNEAGGFKRLRMK
jgi:hypothetical protein